MYKLGKIEFHFEFFDDHLSILPSFVLNFPYFDDLMISNFTITPKSIFPRSKYFLIINSKQI